MDIGSPPFRTPFGALQVHTEEFIIKFYILLHQLSIAFFTSLGTAAHFPSSITLVLLL
jgi:hypothetical protein